MLPVRKFYSLARNSLLWAGSTFQSPPRPQSTRHFENQFHNQLSSGRDHALWSYRALSTDQGTIAPHPTRQFIGQALTIIGAATSATCFILPVSGLHLSPGHILPQCYLRLHCLRPDQRQPRTDHDEPWSQL